MPFEAAEDRLRGDPVRLALVGQAHRNSLATLAVQAASAIGVTVIALPAERPFHVAWLVVVMVVLAARVVLDRLTGAALAGKRLRNRLAVLAALNSLGLIVSAGLWAYLAVARIPLDSPLSRYALIVVLSALAGGATGVLSPLKWTGRIYITLILVPASVTLIVGGGSEIVLGALGLIFCGVMLVGHRNNHALLVDCLRLRDENRDLIADIQRRNHDAGLLNRDLETRVRARTQQLELLSEKAQVANRSKSQFLAMVSHEMRTPLNAILGEGQLLAREPLTAPQRARLGVIKTASRVMRQLIDDILDISQIESGSLQLRLNAFSLDTLVSEVRELHLPLAQERGLSLTLSVQPDLARYRRGDAERLSQLIGNLVDNALKFTRQGGVTVKINGDDRQLQVAVIDTGIGIAAKDHESIFERFVQVDNSSTRKVGGIGLGLAICREISEQMGGTLKVTSAPGIGARFDFSAPIPSVVSSEPLISGAEEDEDQAPNQVPASLLIVDDNPVNRRILAALVQHFGVTCGFAENGREAVEAWRSQPWDAIFMDIHMPEMDGLEATLAIRREEARTGVERTPIIAVTASVLPHEVEGYVKAGMDGVLPKPVEAAALAATLSQCMAAAA
ncbi:ATP-binding protein [Caulobacter henricii]|uniref:histidine kinase n=1 Tax=Caulobacter henricii TaxID=69395 RepID=A0A0P0P0P9_9CAUL|nr:ATP-binding protein [Caulobacter henricii]ALL13793.1 histidine kinase [Caulobacter henricii]